MSTASRQGKRRRGAEKAVQPRDASPVLERPDGYYWLAPDGQLEVGPFESYELAQAHRDAVGDEALAPGDALQQAEREVGVTDWLDPETGAPAEGESPPHLQEE